MIQAGAAFLSAYVILFVLRLPFAFPPPHLSLTEILLPGTGILLVAASRRVRGNPQQS